MRNTLRITLIEDSYETYKNLVDSLGRSQDNLQIQFICSAPFFDSEIEATIKEFNPCLILLDLLLTDSAESGFRVLIKLKASYRLKDYPVVVCSKYIGDDEQGQKFRQRAIDLGAKEALPKFPFPKRAEILNLAGLELHSEAEHSGAVL